MIKRHTAILAAILLSASPVWAKSSGMRATAERLYSSLTTEQREQACRPFDDPARKQEQFTGGKRVGVQIRDLKPEQKQLAIELLTAFTSDYGRRKAEAIAAQEGKGGLDQYYVAFFGTPGEAETYAWRIAEHHLTLVDAEFVGDRLVEFGPILLGANPPTLWDEEEDDLIALYGAMTPAEHEKAGRQGKIDSAKPMPKDTGIAVRELSDAAQQKLQAMFARRLQFYSDEIRLRVLRMVEQQGGLAAMRLAYWGVADQRCADGGRWDFKLGDDTFLCDYENTRGHIHLSMKGRAISPDDKPQATTNKH